MGQGQGQIWNYNTTKNYEEYNSKSLTDYWILMIHIMMDINEHQDQRYTRGDNNGRDLYLLGVNVLVIYTHAASQSIEFSRFLPVVFMCFVVQCLVGLY